MQDFFFTALAVLNWRIRSLVVLSVGVGATAIFGYVASNSLAKLSQSNSLVASGLFDAFRPVFGFVFIAFMIMWVGLGIRMFIKDWEAYHRRW